jgi:hypothetical protein
MMVRSPTIKFYFQRLNSDLIPAPEVHRAVVIGKGIGVDGRRAVASYLFLFCLRSGSLSDIVN